MVVNGNSCDYCFSFPNDLVSATEGMKGWDVFINTTTTTNYYNYYHYYYNYYH